MNHTLSSKDINHNNHHLEYHTYFRLDISHQDIKCICTYLIFAFSKLIGFLFWSSRESSFIIVIKDISCKKLFFIARTGLKYDRGTREYFKGCECNEGTFYTYVLQHFIYDRTGFNINLYKIIIIDSIFYE
jgi:hypothetical protein